MDSDELDRWLDEEAAGHRAGPEGSASGATDDVRSWTEDLGGMGGREPGRPRGRGSGHRGGPDGGRPVAAILGAAAVVCLLATIVLMATRSPLPEEPSGSDRALIEGADGLIADADSPIESPDGRITGAEGPMAAGGTGDPTSEASMSSVPADAGADGTVETGQGASSSSAVPPAMAAAAVAAMRARLTTEGPTSSYLEWATPVSWQPREAGVSLVMVDAIWLEGVEGTLSTARRGRWVVALGDDGTLLNPPWPTGIGPQATPIEVEPPTGELRLAEVSVAMQSSGWTEVTAIAADPHPLLPDVLVALIDGIAPGDAVVQTAVVWLDGGAEGAVRLLGSAT